MHLFSALLDGIDNAASDDGIDQELDDEVDTDDGKDEDEWIGIGAKFVNDRCSIIEEAEGRHEENRVEQGGTGTAHGRGDDAFFVLDLDGVIDETGKEADEDSADDTHDDETAEVSAGTDFSAVHTALEKRGCGIHAGEGLDHGDATPDETGDGTHPWTEDDSHDADRYAHQGDGQGGCLDGSNRCEAEDEHDGDHQG